MESFLHYFNNNYNKPHKVILYAAFNGTLHFFTWQTYTYTHLIIIDEKCLENNNNNLCNLNVMYGMKWKKVM